MAAKKIHKSLVEPTRVRYLNLGVKDPRSIEVEVDGEVFEIRHLKNLPWKRIMEFSSLQKVISEIEEASEENIMESLELTDKLYSIVLGDAYDALTDTLGPETLQEIMGVAQLGVPPTEFNKTESGDEELPEGKN